MISSLEQLLTALCRDLNITEVPQMDQEKIYALSLPPETTLFFREEEDGVTIRAKLCTVPSLDKEELFMLLMKANLLGQGTGGAVIGLSEENEELSLSLCLTYSLNDKIFKMAVEDFVNYLDYWKEEIARFQRRAEERII